MSRKAPKICTYPGCGKPVAGGRCDLHKHVEAKAFDKARGTAASRGYCSKQWLWLRQQVLLRDQYKCQKCGVFVVRKGQAHVDHIIPKSSGGTDDMSNLMLLCVSCHSLKTTSEGGFTGKH